MLAALVAFVLAVLVLAGWGMDDWSGLFADPARASTVALMLVGVAVLGIAELGLQPLRRDKGRHTAQALLLFGMAAASACLLWLLPHYDRRGFGVFAANEAMRWTGVALLCAGAAIRLRALHDLGPQFSAYVTLRRNTNWSTSESIVTFAILYISAWCWPLRDSRWYSAASLCFLFLR